MAKQQVHISSDHTSFRCVSSMRHTTLRIFSGAAPLLSPGYIPILCARKDCLLIYSSRAPYGSFDLPKDEVMVVSVIIQEFGGPCFTCVTQRKFFLQKAVKGNVMKPASNIERSDSPMTTTPTLCTRIDQMCSWPTNTGHAALLVKRSTRGCGASYFLRRRLP